MGSPMTSCEEMARSSRPARLTAGPYVQRFGTMRLTIVNHFPACQRPVELVMNILIRETGRLSRVLMVLWLFERTRMHRRTASATITLSKPGAVHGVLNSICG